MTKRTTGNIALEYINKFPDTPTMTLARKMVKDHPLLFDVERARTRIRYYRGALGKSRREKMKKTSPETIREVGEAGWKYALPPTKALPWSNYEIQFKKTLILSDIHIPFQDNTAIETAIKFGLDYKPNCILLNGDIHDCYSISKYNKDPRLRDFPDELKSLEQLFQYLRERFPKIEIIFKLGNHEERYEIYMFSRAPDMVGTSTWEYSELINANKYKIKVVKDKQIIKLGKLPIIHGHEFMRGAFNPVNPARGLFLRGVHTALTGHWHRTSDHAERTLDDKVITTWSQGCLCDLHPQYSPLNKWNHGFAIVESSEDFRVQNKRIWNGKVL